MAEINFIPARFPEQGYWFGFLLIGVESYITTFQSVILDRLIAI